MLVLHSKAPPGLHSVGHYQHDTSPLNVNTHSQTFVIIKYKPDVQNIKKCLLFKQIRVWLQWEKNPQKLLSAYLSTGFRKTACVYLYMRARLTTSAKVMFTPHTVVGASLSSDLTSVDAVFAYTDDCQMVVIIVNICGCAQWNLRFPACSSRESAELQQHHSACYAAGVMQGLVSGHLALPTVLSDRKQSGSNVRKCCTATGGSLAMCLFPIIIPVSSSKCAFCSQ